MTCVEQTNKLEAIDETIAVDGRYRNDCAFCLRFKSSFNYTCSHCPLFVAVRMECFYLPRLSLHERLVGLGFMRAMVETGDL